MYTHTHWNQTTNISKWYDDNNDKRKTWGEMELNKENICTYKIKNDTKI